MAPRNEPASDKWMLWLIGYPYLIWVAFKVVTEAWMHVALLLAFMILPAYLIGKAYLRITDTPTRSKARNAHH